MPRPKILQENANYTFRSYFELPYDTDEILAEFGYSFTQSRLKLPITSHQVDNLAKLRESLEESIPYVTLSSEAAKREIFIAPVLIRVAIFCKQLLRIEYPIKVSNWLQGNLDYFIQSEHNLIVIEAKRDDLTRGFTQLAVELIAVSMLYEELNFIYGAVTIGNLWIFGTLDRNSHLITRDISSYALPDDAEELVKTLIGILEQSRS
ncbi:MAG: hypothetical protein KME64_07715 [Scytonematopsis contorta HA4267-MV1]|jgi:hypothetical protein|nr:hypothetical protein [Scytonematopsis contorta HA4267-MV1]